MISPRLVSQIHVRSFEVALGLPVWIFFMEHTSIRRKLGKALAYFNASLAKTVVYLLDVANFGS